MIGTVVLTRPSLCSKSDIFIEAWHIVNLQPRSCPLQALIPHIRAFNWCILLCSSSRDSKVTSHQILKSPFSLHSTLIPPTSWFLGLRKWPRTWRPFYVVKRANGTFEIPKSTFWHFFSNKMDAIKGSFLKCKFLITILIKNKLKTLFKINFNQFILTNWTPLKFCNYQID